LLVQNAFRSKPFDSENKKKKKTTRKLKIENKRKIKKTYGPTLDFVLPGASPSTNLAIPKSEILAM
jgi:hypothetical protein